MFEVYEREERFICIDVHGGLYEVEEVEDGIRKTSLDPKRKPFVVDSGQFFMYAKLGINYIVPMYVRPKEFDEIVDSLRKCDYASRMNIADEIGKNSPE